MSLEPALTPIEPATSAVYASFFLSGEEIAIDVAHVQEVVNFPAAVTPMPLAPDFVLGVFDLRSAVIPVLDMKRLLRSQDETRPPGAKVAILEIQGVLLGLVFDDTSRVLRPRADQRRSFHYAEGTSHRVVRGVLRIGDDLLVNVLDPNELVRVENVPQVVAGQRNGPSLRLVVRKKCITFSVGGMKLGFAIGDIREIVPLHGITRSALQDDLTTGLIRIRDRIIPVVTFARLLGREPDSQAPGDRRVVVIDFERERVGLLVDAVDGIDAYAPDAVAAVPLLSKERMAMFTGCVHIPERGHVFLLDRRGLFDNAEISRITQNHGSLLAEGAGVEKRADKRGGGRQVYLSFRVQHLFAIPLREVKEIINVGEILPLPGAPPFVLGVLNLRGKLVVVADTRAVYRLPPRDDLPREARKIIVFERDGGLYGLLVDSVDSIVTAQAGGSFQLPEVLQRGLAKGVQQDVREIIEVTSSAGNVTLVVLNIERLLSAVRLEQAA